MSKNNISNDNIISNNNNYNLGPALGPDLKPMEHIWGKLARKVYENGRQYFSIKELKIAIQQA